jgi:hypothetical protein
MMQQQQQSTNNKSLGVGSSAAHETTSGSGAEEEEYEQQTLLPSSNSSSTGLPNKRQRWSLSILSYEPRKREHLGLNQRSWSGGKLIFLTLASVGALVSLFFSSNNDVDRAVVTKDTEERIIQPTTTMGRHFPPPNKTSAEEEANSVMKQQQIKNYINGTAIIRDIHITHHAGTSVCNQMKKLGPTPQFACIGNEKNIDTIWPSEAEIEASHLDMTKGSGLTHWEYEDTEAWVKFWRPYFHFVSMEFRSFGNLHTTNWEYENLVSMIVMRDPMERFLAGGKCSVFHRSLPGDPTEDTQDLYWEYANSDCADNYALRVLVNKTVCVMLVLVFFSHYFHPMFIPISTPFFHFQHSGLCTWRGYIHCVLGECKGVAKQIHVHFG